MWRLFLLLALVSATNSKKAGYNGQSYPDIRGQDWKLCANVSQRFGLYFCDPDHLLNNSQATIINKRLNDLIQNTPCHCQRRSQCETENTEGKLIKMGFVVTVAMVDKILLTDVDPTPDQQRHYGERFAEVVRGRWALGDCGNSALILIWKEYKKIFVARGRITEKYLTTREVEVIRTQVQQYIVEGQYSRALLLLLDNIEAELNGDPEGRIDTGTLSLIISVSLAVVLVCIITGCVCAFRCCGNLRPDPETRVGRALGRVDSIKAEVIRRGSQLRRSISRSPKFTRSPQQPKVTLDPPGESSANVFGYDYQYKGPYEGTSMV